MTLTTLRIAHRGPAAWIWMSRPAVHNAFDATLIAELTDTLRQLVLDNVSALELRRTACAEGMRTLRQNGLLKVCEGVTTVDEVVRETVH